MNDKLKTLQISQYNTDYPVTLLYDRCKNGTSQYGTWNLYGVVYDKEPQGLFVDERLHAMLNQYRKGDQVVIRREQDLNGNLSWCVSPEASKTAPLIISQDTRTKDIHRQLCLKVSVMSFPKLNKHWDDEIISEIKSRTESLLEILDGSVPES
ncbi:MAG: hypothetical protein V3U16_03145 [Candidatus Neomarinimicrobiota bacterium]